MNNNNILNGYSGLRDTYLESMRESLAPPYRGRLGAEQVAEVIQKAMDNMPPMEREAFANLSLQNLKEGFDWGGLIKNAAPAVGGLIGGPTGTVVGKTVGDWATTTFGQSQTVAPRRTFPARPAPPAPAVSIENQIKALFSDPQFLQGLKQVLGIANTTTTAPSPSIAAPRPANTAAVSSGSANTEPKEAYYSESLNAADDYRPGYWYTDRYGKRRWRPGYHYYPSRRTPPVVRPSVVRPTVVRPVTYVPSAPAVSQAPAWTAIQSVGSPQAVGAPPQQAWTPTPAFDPAQTSPPPEPVPDPSINLKASELMALISSPQFSQAMSGQILGSVGSGNATVQQGNELVDIPFGAMMNALVELGQQASAESVRMGGEESERYLMDSEGNYKIDDPSNPEERAGAVMEMLREDHSWRNRKTAEPLPVNNSYDPVTEWLIEAGMV